MKQTVTNFEPQARALLRIILAFMILCHGLREVFGLLPARPRGPGSFMPLDPLGQPGGICLLIFGTLILIGWFTRPAALLLAVQCLFAYFYAAAPRGIWPITNGGIDTLSYVFIFIYFSAAGPGAWSLDALSRKNAPVVSQPA